jgi:hypothetical protein
MRSITVHVLFAATIIVDARHAPIQNHPPQLTRKSFAVEDGHAEYDGLRSAGAAFTQPPVAMGPVTTAVFDDTCGNVIQIAAQQ